MSEGVTRLSVSLPPDLLDQLDVVVEERGMPSRSHAVAEMIRGYVLDHTGDRGEGLMAGVITVVYANDRSRLRVQLLETQHRYLKEVISSQHVFLEADQSLEALLVQGPAEVLRSLADEMMACRGVRTVKLAITAALLPPIHVNREKKNDGS